jgi:hypothetical protein
MSTYLALDDLRYVTYSHSDYLDVLQIHVDHIKKKKKKSLLINHCKLPESISAYYDQIIFYDDALPYASRIYTGVSGIEEDFFVLMHDNDILISQKDNEMHMVATVFQHRKMHRLDLKHTPLKNVDDLIRLNYEYELHKKRIVQGNDYVYNVNPSIWDKKCLLEIMKKFHDLSYREIEKYEVQQFCSNKDFYFVHCPDPNRVKHAGHFLCPDIFVFLHITHGGKFLPTNGSSVYGQTYRDVEDKYKGIVNRYNLMENERGFG